MMLFQGGDFYVELGIHEERLSWSYKFSLRLVGPYVCAAVGKVIMKKKQLKKCDLV